MNKLISKSFLWMGLGLLVTFLTGFYVSTSETMITNIFNSSLFYILIILEFVLVIFFSARVHKMSPTAAKICFLLYSFISGLTFSSIFIVFEVASIIYIFLISAVIFGLFGLIGYKINMDLTKVGTYLLMALIGVILVSIVNLFLHSDSLSFILSILVLIIFMGFTAYDIQKIKRYAESGIDNEVVSIYGAFELYLDFINIFIKLLQLFGRSRD